MFLTAGCRERSGTATCRPSRKWLVWRTSNPVKPCQTKSNQIKPNICGGTERSLRMGMGKNDAVRALDPAVRIGHVHLKVADLDRALAFYRDVLGFEVTQQLGRQAAFLSAGGYHHHIGLNTWESAGGPPPPPGTTG